MERVQAVIRRPAAALLLAATVAAAGGCVTAAKMTDVVKEDVLAVRPPPATQVICFWQRQLTVLPDPTRSVEGGQTRGLPGQVFLIGERSGAVEVDGDLTMRVSDETPRPPGQPPHTDEVWHFKKEHLKRLLTHDERFGKSYALFLPWPEDWKDVAAVSIKARYQSDGRPDLYDVGQKLTLDPAGSVTVSTDRAGQPAGGFDSRGVPDSRTVLQQMKANPPGFAVPAPSSGVAPASGFGPPPTGFGSQPVMPADVPALTLPSPATPPVPPPAGGLQPIIIPSRGL